MTPGSRARGAWGLAAALLLLAVDATAATPAPDAGRPRVTSTRTSPGWYPVVDPESMSVVLGRRTNAPIVRKPLAGGTRSLDALGRTVCRALQRGDVDSLRMLCVRDDEFRDILWREFPQSRPVTGITWRDAWIIVGARLNSGCSGAVNDFGGRYLEFVRFEPTTAATRFKNFRLHDGLVLVARNATGGLERMTWLRSVVERNGVFKIYGVSD